jgi:hypothetical protein
MSRATVRAALYNFFGGANPNVAGIKTIFQAQPKQIARSQLPAMFFMLPESMERRHAIQKKIITYQTYIIVTHVGYDTDSQTAEQAFEQILDNIAAKIRSDHTLSGNVLKFGEQIETNVHVERNKEATLLDATLIVDTVEILTA